MYFNRSSSVCALAFLALIVFCVLPSLNGHRSPQAATCVTNPVVANNSDSGAGSLRQAILDACDGSTITFANTVASPITLASELAVDKNLTIQGPGANVLTISGNSAVRVFNIGSVNPAINVMISGLTMANGMAALINAAGLGTDYWGGAVFNNSAGTVSLAGDIISGNTGPSLPFGGAAGGGGVFNNSVGTVLVTDTNISGNLGHNGGGIYNNRTGTVNITNSSIIANRATILGGGIVNYGILSVTGSSISLNTGSGHGGGILTVGAATVANSIVSGNATGGVGGGIAIYPAGGLLTLTNSTISGNTAFSFGGGCYVEGFARVINSTIFGNSASNGGGFSNFRDLRLTNSTISGNIAIGDPSSPNAATGLAGGVFTDPSAIVNVGNTIIALNGPFDIKGTFASQGHNLIGIGTTGSGFFNGINGELVGSLGSPLDPKLGPLQNNGGPTLTMALLPGSPAIDAGDDSVLGAPMFLTTDQRGAGFPRKAGVYVDIGAFEFQGPSPGPSSFDACLKDGSSGNLLQINSTTGQYKFTRCSDGFMITGTGVVRTVNGILTLTDSRPDRRISAGLNTGQRTGSATIYIMIAPGVWQSFRINSTNPSAVCSCGI